jgi:hypothetical protein
MNDLRVGELTITPSMLDQGKTYKAVPAAAWRDYLAGHGWRLVHTDEKGVHRPGYDTAANIPAEAYTAVADGKLLVSVIPEHFGDYVTWSFSLLSDLERHEDRWKGFILAEVLQHSEASP